MAYAEVAFIGPISNHQECAMSNSKLAIDQLSQESAEPSHLEKFVGLEPVANSNCDSANSEQYERAYPEHGYQAGRLLGFLLKGNTISPLDAWRLLGIYRLAAVVHSLKNDYGWAVKNLGLRVVNRFGEEGSIGLYRLPADEIERAGKRGMEYAQCETAIMGALAAFEQHRQRAR